MLCMERENNRMNAESHEYNRVTNQLSCEMAVINRDIHVLNRKSTHAAIKTGQTTRTNVQVSIVPSSHAPC